MGVLLVVAVVLLVVVVVVVGIEEDGAVPLAAVEEVED